MQLVRDPIRISDGKLELEAEGPAIGLRATIGPQREHTFFDEGNAAVALYGAARKPPLDRERVFGQPDDRPGCEQGSG